MTTKILLAVVLMNFKIFALKIISVSEFQRFESNSFHSVMVDEKYKSLKNLIFIVIGSIMCISNSMLAIRLWDYIKYLFWFLYILRKRQFPIQTSLLKGDTKRSSDILNYKKQGGADCK